MTKLSALTVALLLAVAAATAQAQALRPEVGKPLQQASAALKAGNAKDAMAKVREADAVGGKTPAETLMIERMRAAAAQRMGDHGTAARSLEAVYPRLSGGEAAQVAEQLAFAYSNTREFAKAKEWLGKAQAGGGGSAQLKQLAAYLQSQSGDYGAIAKEAAAAVSAAEQAGRRPDEGDLLRLADAQQRTGNQAGQTHTLEKLLANYPKKEYWSIYLSRVQRKPGFSDRFALDVMRLKLALGSLSKTEEYMEMAQLAIQAGYPAEGKAVVDKGFAAGALGTGAEAERHKRLRELADKRDVDARASLEQRITEATALREGNDLVQLGYTLVTLGQADRGITLIEQGIAKGNLKRPDDAKLRLGLAMLKSGKNKAKAVQVLRSVQGTDGAADVGRLWALYANTQG
jgi:hypothetical protein